MDDSDILKFWMVLMFGFLFLFLIVAAVEAPESSPVTCEQAVVCPEGCEPVSQNQSSSETSFDVFMKAFLLIAISILFSIIILTILDM
ncbi:MAG: hypothetical protein WCY37_04130 [Candidatus Dojkabacteria bacterium]